MCYSSWNTLLSIVSIKNGTIKDGVYINLIDGVTNETDWTPCPGSARSALVFRSISSTSSTSWTPIMSTCPFLLCLTLSIRFAAITFAATP